MIGSRQPVQQYIHSLPGADDITRIELANGIVVLSRPNYYSMSVVVTGFLPAGGLLDPDPKLGLADFTASALMRGTERRNFQQIYDELESSGASLRFGSGTHSVGFNGQALSEDLDLLLELCSEALRHPVFPTEQVERLRAQLLSSLAIREQDTAYMAQWAFEQLVYSGHPYSRPEDGYPETVQAITQQDLINFHQKNYGPQGMVLVIVGAVDPQVAVDNAARVLGDWDNPLQPGRFVLPELVPLGENHRKQVNLLGKFQIDLVIGAAGPSRHSAYFQAANLGNSILGQFGMMGRIGQAVREDAGLAYYCQSSLSGGYGPGPWNISAGVDSENLELAIELIRQEVDRFVSEPVEPEELQDVQSQFIGSLPLSMESNYGVASALINLERYQLGLDYYRQYPTMIQTITRENILQAARNYLHPDRLAIGIAGTLNESGNGN